ncbi:MAG: reactive intermediate/imine deaminase [Flavobacteriales bacterium]|nr:reactive intermediate/imine deaminase [Flavobacteriales bacterium]|tara:strand:- start:2591 stop:2968 length:378 start_codon:yes stop_codon:yes gene_type:complete
MAEIINTENAPSPIGPYNQSVRTGNLLFVSGQVPFIAETMELVTESVEAETHQVMKNIDAILRKAGLSLSNIVKASIFCKDLNDFTRINEVYGSYFRENYPARECVEVSRLPKDVNVEISVIAEF